MQMQTAIEFYELNPYMFVQQQPKNKTNLHTFIFSAALVVSNFEAIFPKIMKIWVRGIEIPAELLFRYLAP